MLDRLLAIDRATLHWILMMLNTRLSRLYRRLNYLNCQ